MLKLVLPYFALILRYFHKNQKNANKVKSKCTQIKALKFPLSAKLGIPKGYKSIHVKSNSWLCSEPKAHKSIMLLLLFAFICVFFF